MDPGRELAFAVLNALESGATWDGAWSGATRGATPATPRARGVAHELASGTTRLRGRLDAVLAPHSSRPFARLDPAVRVLLRLGAYQLLEADGATEYAVVHETVEQTKQHARYAAGFVNAVLRSVLRGGAELPEQGGTIANLAAATSHPHWLVKRWLERFGAAETATLCAYDNRRPELCLRANLRRTTRDALLSRLPGSVAGQWSPVTIRLPTPKYGVARALVEAGEASVQDESGTMVGLVVAAGREERVLDLAAAPGGKACHMGEAMDDTGIVGAFDRTDDKVARIRDNAARLGLTNVTATVADGRRVRTEPADAVLLDAPCSGLGVLARRPDLRWRKQPEDLPRLAALQSALLENAAAHVRPGGRLIYSVCSFEPEETSGVTAQFAARHPEFEPDDVDVPESLRSGPGILYCLPQRHGVDGGFVARWRRTGTR